MTTYSLGQFLEQSLDTKDAKELIGDVTGLDAMWDKALTMFLRDEITGTGKGLEEIRGGMDLLPERLIEKHKLYPDNIRLNTEVASIQLIGGKAIIHIRRNGELIPLPLYDHVICTIPFSVLRGMNIEGLSPHKMRSIRHLCYESSTKVLLNCTRRFWEGVPYHICGGASLSDEISRSTYYPSCHVRSIGAVAKGYPIRPFGSLFTQVPRKINAAPNDQRAGVLVGSYTWGLDARRLGSMPEEKAAEAVVNSIRKFHPEIEKVIDRHSGWYKVMFWDKHEWSRGAFCFMRPNDLRNYYHNAIHPEGNLHFAGEHCSVDPGWIQGAIKSSIRVVEEILSISPPMPPNVGNSHTIPLNVDFSFSNNILYANSYDSKQYGAPDHCRYLENPLNPQWQSLSLNAQTGGGEDFFNLVNGEVRVLYPGTYRINGTAHFNHHPNYQRFNHHPTPRGQFDPSLKVQLGILLNGNIVQTENHFRTLSDKVVGINRMPYYYLIDCNVTLDTPLKIGNTLGLSVSYNVHGLLVGLEKLTLTLLQR